MPHNPNWRLTSLRYPLLLLLWVAIATVGLYVKSLQLFISFDGNYMRSLAYRQFEWHTPLFLTSIDLFQGLGDRYFPVNYRLFPSFIVGSLFGNGIAGKVATYSVILVELCFAVFLFARSIGAARIIAFSAAILSCLLLFPFYRSGLVFSLFALTPPIGTYIAACLILAAAFFQFGRRGWLADLPYALVSLALLAWAILAGPPTFLLCAPFLLVCMIAGFIAAENRKERIAKIALAAIGGGAFLLMGPAAYLASLLLATAASVYPLELTNDRANYYNASILFHWKSVGASGPLLVILAIIGCAYALRDSQNRRLRALVIPLLGYLAISLTFAVLTIEFDFWRGPTPLLFEFFIIPVYAILAVYATLSLANLLIGRVQKRSFFVRLSSCWNSVKLQPDIKAFAVFAIMTLGFVTLFRAPDHGFHFPPKSTPLVQRLVDEIGMRPEAEPQGAPFRGNTVNMTGRLIETPVTWLDLHVLDSKLSDSSGNTLRSGDLHMFGVPTLFSYSPTMSPAFYAVTTRLLSRPDDEQMRSVSVLRHIAPRTLSMLGVRFVITDAPFGGDATLRMTEQEKDRTLYLYEIDHPNVGNYSPTLVANLGGATAIIARMADGDFDPAREILADIPTAASGLVAATDSHLTFDGTSVRLRAQSSGHSLLLLPLEFSECLKATSTASETPQLFRANLVQTAVLFSGKIDTVISLRTGPFLNPTCRFQDYVATKALHVGDVPTVVRN
jgi:hypothetical protein